MGDTGVILHYMLWLSRSFYKKVTIVKIANRINGFRAPAGKKSVKTSSKNKKLFTAIFCKKKIRF